MALFFPESCFLHVAGDGTGVLGSFSARLGELYDALSAWNAAALLPVWLEVLFLCAGALVALGPRWPLLRVGVTFFHELGHALSGLLVGARITRIMLHVDTSGVTHWQFAGHPGRLRTAFVAFWGYPFAAFVAGFGLLSLLSNWGRLFAAVTALVVALVLLLWVRNFWGMLVCAGFLLFAGPLVWYLPAAGPAAAALLAGFLLVGCLRTVVEHISSGSVPGSDSVVVAREVFLPAAVVRYLMLLSAIGLFTLPLLLY